MPRLCTAIHDGQPCTYRARPGQLFCAGHNPRTFVTRPCHYFNRRGRPCANTAILGHDHCFTHSPRNRRAKRPSVPLVPRTRRQRAQAKSFGFRQMPQPPTTVPEVPQWL